MCSLINKQLLLIAYAYLFITEQQKGLQGSEALQIENGAVELCPCFQNNLGEIQSFLTDLFADVKQLLRCGNVAVLTLGHLNDARAKAVKHYDPNTQLIPRIDSFLRQRTQHIQRTNCLERDFHKELAELDKLIDKARLAAPTDREKMSKPTSPGGRGSDGDEGVAAKQSPGRVEFCALRRRMERTDRLVDKLLVNLDRGDVELERAFFAQGQDRLDII